MWKRTERQTPRRAVKAAAPTRFSPASSPDRHRHAPQASLGNQGVLRLLETRAISQPHDPAEQEADRIAEAVGAGARASHDVDARAAGPAPLTEASGADLGGGQPLDPATRGFFEPRFGVDLGGVRVHQDAWAAQSALAFGAHAYTVGRHMVFGRGRYAPSSVAGRKLVAHELTHALQQARSAADPAALRRSRPAARGIGGDAAPLVERGVPHLGVRQSAALHIACKREPDMPDYWDPRAPMPRPPRAAYYVFEEAYARSPDTAPLAFRDYGLLTPKEKRLAFEISYGSGNLQKALKALGPANAIDDRYSGSVQELLRWVEEAEAQQAFGANEEAMVEKQASFLRSDPSVTVGGWGGTKKTRWKSLLGPARADWTKRGKAAITKMAAFAAAHAPELKVTEATFELKFHEVDLASLGAIATGGSKPGKTVMVGFEFVAAVEVNPKYALSTVVHELYGHPLYDSPGGRTYGGDLYARAAAEAKKKGVKIKDLTGSETFNYYQSEIYSLLKEVPYWTAVSKDDTGKTLDVGGTTTTPERINYDPRGAIESWIGEINKRWEPSVGIAMLAGFYRRIKLDPTIDAKAVKAFEQRVKKVFGANADKILE